MELEPIIPFEPIQSEKIPTGPNWIAQIKWDGIRMLTYFDGQSTRLWNRRRNERTLQYPELLDVRAYCTASSVILDGEIIAMDDAKPSFHQIMKRESLRKEVNIAKARHQTPVTYMLFDLLMLNGEWVTDKPLAERQRLLERVIRPQPSLQLTPSVPDGRQLYELMKAHRMEGIVCKDLMSTYAIGGKDARWMKRKIFHDLYAVIGGVTYRDGTVNAILLGLYDREGRFVYIGHAGTGLVSREEWRQLTALVEGMKIPQHPFVNEPERNSKEWAWLAPQLTVKIQYMEWTPNGTMRHPSIQAFGGAELAACTFAQL
ncbi:DNA ligase [Paenibacillus oryzisoli]|uniref:ATP-dependent DNA ligase n=1 Tax=Paenibacillus oryzisoli TaxID=1850517 RepID=UPI003D2C951E